MFSKEEKVMSYGYEYAKNNETFAEAFVREVNNNLRDIKHSFIEIGFRLNEADRFEYYKELGYSSIIELAEKEFGFKKSKTYNLINVWALARDKDCPMRIAKAFEKYNYTQLLLMSKSKHPFDNSRLACIIPATATKEQIHRAINHWNCLSCVAFVDKEEFRECFEQPITDKFAEKEVIFHPEGEEGKEIFHPDGKSVRAYLNNLSDKDFSDVIVRKFLSLKKEFGDNSFMLSSAFFCWLGESLKLNSDLKVTSNV